MNPRPLHVIEPARLKPGVTVDSLPGPRASDLAGETSDVGLVRGRALIFWDPKRPGKKLDAIDTDQITPAADCVSESLETLDERWKAGSFRYLMPDFRKRVHDGATFVIAGERFAIGSSREMSPAGLKGVAEEVGLKPRMLTFMLGDTHVYENHIETFEEQYQNSPRTKPTWSNGHSNGLFNFSAQRAELLNYISHGIISYQLNTQEGLDVL